MNSIINRKFVENLFLAACGPEIVKDKTARKIVKEQAKDAAKAFEIGIRDGEGGRPLEQAKQDYKKGLAFAKSDIAKVCIKNAYRLYLQGYKIGEVKQNGSS